MDGWMGGWMDILPPLVFLSAARALFLLSSMSFIRTQPPTLTEEREKE
jgi:hypothetical protein